MEVIMSITTRLLGILGRSIQEDRLHTHWSRKTPSVLSTSESETQAVLLHQQLPTIHALVQAIAEIAHQLGSRDNTLGYHSGFYNINGRGRPGINLTSPGVFYQQWIHWPTNCFNSLSTVRQRMSAFGLRYSSISDSQLDALVQDIKEQFPNWL